MSLLTTIDRNNHDNIVNDDKYMCDYEVDKIASSRDDAVGEVFDKISRLL